MMEAVIQLGTTIDGDLGAPGPENTVDKLDLCAGISHPPDSSKASMRYPRRFPLLKAFHRKFKQVLS